MLWTGDVPNGQTDTRTTRIAMAMYLAISARRSGPSFLHPLVEIGFAYGTCKDDMMKKRWLIKCTTESEQALIGQMADSWQSEYNESSSIYRLEHWADDDWDAIQNDKAVQPAKVVYAEVAEFLNSLTAEHKETPIRLLCQDETEIAHIDFWLLTTGNRFLGCRYDVHGQELNVDDPYTGALLRVSDEEQDAADELVDAWSATLNNNKEFRSDDHAQLLLVYQFAIDQVLAKSNGVTHTGADQA